MLFSDYCDPVNIGNDVETSILEFAEIINRLTGNQAGIEFRPSNRIEGDPQRRRPDISRAIEVLNWEPTIRLEEGLERTIPYFKEKLGVA